MAEVHLETVSQSGMSDSDSLEQYVRELITSWVRSRQFRRKMAKRREGTSDGDDSKKEGGGEEQGRGKARRRGRMKARIPFLTISFILLVGCNVFSNTSQTRAFENGYGHLYIGVYLAKLVGIVLYLTVNNSDPGFIKGERVYGAAEQRGDYCTKCHHIMPQRAKHCRECGRCVAKFDHHCPFVGTCIGAKNQKLFWFFLFFEWIPAFASARLVASLFDDQAGTLSHISFFCRLLFSLFALAMFTFVSLILLQQTFNILLGQTTYEFILRNRIVKYAKLHESLTGTILVHTIGLLGNYLCIRPHAYMYMGYARNLEHFCLKPLKPQWVKYDPQHRNWFHLIPEVPKKSKNSEKSITGGSPGEKFSHLKRLIRQIRTMLREPLSCLGLDISTRRGLSPSNCKSINSENRKNPVNSESFTGFSKNFATLL
ncbi:hypothetical protein AAMO2058_000866100 [Amorphochlora amoebiformis]